MFQTILHSIGSAFLTAGVFIASIFGVQAPEHNLGASIPVVVSTFQTSLQTSITSSATSMTLVTGTDASGDALSGYTCFNIDEGTSTEEFVCGTAAGTAVTSMIRGIDPVDGDLEVTALKKAHRRGASVKVTDYPSLAIISRILAGTETLPAPINYATGVGPVGSSDLADKEYVLSVVTGGTVTTDQLIVSGNAGETVAAGNILYLKSTDTEWYKADADTANNVENVIMGIAQGAGTDGVAISGGILLKGVDNNQTGLSANTIYYASNTAGGLSSSPGTKEAVIGISKSTTSLYFAPRFAQQLTEDEQDAIAGGSTFGTPSSTNKFITQDYNSSATGLPVIRTYTTESTSIGGSTTQFDITNPSGTTFRYTFDSTGTDPTIDCTANPIGSLINFQAQNMTAANNGVFVLTGCGSNYVEVTNASGVAEVNKTLGTGYVVESGTSTWSKPSGLKYIVVKAIGGGGGGAGSTTADSGCGGGGGGGYSEEIIQASSLNSSEYYIVGAGGEAGPGSGGSGGTGRISNFGNYLYATGGGGGNCTGNDYSGGVGGLGFNGTLNIKGGGGNSSSDGTGVSNGGAGGSSALGGGAYGPSKASGGGIAGIAGGAYGGGGSGATNPGGDGSDYAGGAGGAGALIITEHFN